MAKVRVIPSTINPVTLSPLSKKNPNGSLLKFMPMMVFLEQVPREEKVSMK